VKRIVYTGELPAIEARFLAALKSNTKEKPFGSHVVLCTSHLLGAYLRRQAASSGIPLFNVRFYTFDTLAAELLPLDYQKKKLISPLGELSLLRKIVRTNPGYFAPVQDKDGFWFALLGAVRDLIDGGIEFIPDGLQKTPKIKDVARILQSYREAVEPFISRSGALELATQNVGQLEGILETDSLTTYGFYDFTFLQKQFLRAAAAKLNVTAFLPYRSGTGYCFAEPTLAFFRQAGFEVASAREEAACAAQLLENDLQRLQARIFQTVMPAGGSPPKSKADRSAAVVGPTGKSYSKKATSSDRSQLSLFDMAANFATESARLASDTRHPTPDTQHLKPETRDSRLPDGTVGIISTADESAEVIEICRAIQLEVERGVDFSEIAVLVRNSEVYLPLIIDIFDANEVPYYLQAGIPLAAAHLTKSLLLFLELLSTNFPRSQVIEFANFAPLRWKALFPKPEPMPQSPVPDTQSVPGFHISPAAWDRLSAKAGIGSGIESWLKRLSALAQELKRELALAESSAEDSESENRSAVYCRLQISQAEALLDFVRALERWKQMFGRCQSWASFAALTAEALENLFIPDGAGQQLRDVIHSVATLDQVSPDTDLEGWIAALRVTLESDQMSAGRFQDGKVSVLTVMGARGIRHRIVFVPGMTERGFPWTARQDPILLDRERKEINEATGGGLPLKSLHSKEELLLFQLCLSAAREKIMFTFPRLDAQTGRQRLLSHYLVRVAEALTGTSHDYQTTEALPHRRKVPLSRLGPEDPIHSLTENEFALSFLSRERRVPASLYHSRLRRSLVAYQARWSRAFTGYDGFLRSADLQSLIEHWVEQEYFSPSRLETFAACPYRFYLQKLMHLQAIQEPETIQQISALDKGSLVHGILDTFMRRAGKEGYFPLAPDSAAQLHQMLEEIAQESFQVVQEKGITGYPLLWELHAAQILNDLHTFLQKEIEAKSEFIPDRFEVSFGKGTGHPVQIELPDGSELKLSGRIDRIDSNRSRTAIRVVDYKTGKFRINEQTVFEGGKKLQLSLYLLAAARLYGLSNLEESMAQYYFVSSAGRFSAHPFTGAQWKEKRERLARLLQLIQTAMRHGLFPATPGEEKHHCKICDFQMICEKAVDRIYNLKSDAPELEFQRLLREFQ
jgi:ATP-dependent helicase/DNAse subunit B